MLLSRSKTTRVAALAVLCLTLATPAEAGCKPFGRRQRAACGAPAAPMQGCGVATYRATTVQYAAAEYVTQPMATAQAAAVEPASPEGSFLAWLNGLRARSGCGPVSWDPGLAAAAERNSQCGFGHFFLVGRRQNSGVAADLATVCQAWVASPAHYAGLIDPAVTRVGVACVGMTWTVNLD